MATDVKHQAQRSGEAIHSGLDVMLADAVAGTPRFFAPGPAVKVAAGLARRPGGVARRAAGLTAELARAATGRSELAPAGGDRRFADRAPAAFLQKPFNSEQLRPVVSRLLG